MNDFTSAVWENGKRIKFKPCDRFVRGVYPCILAVNDALQEGKEHSLKRALRFLKEPRRRQEIVEFLKDELKNSEVPF